MALKTFAAGEILTAQNTNTYLNNGGLVYISETTAAAVATKPLTGIFSSTYENYRIVITNITSNIAGLLTATLGASNITYSYGLYGWTYVGAADNLNLNSGAFWTIARTNTAVPASVTMDIYRPQIAAQTSFTSNSMGQTSSLLGGGTHAQATAYTDLTIGLFTAATFSANIKVYGYRQA